MVRIIAALLAATTGVGAVPPTAEPPGVVLLTVIKGSAGDRAGLRPGDRLVSWTRGAHPGGPLETPFDLLELENVEAPLGPVTFAVRRGADPVAIEVTSGEWGLRARPALSSAARARYEAGRARTQREQRASEWAAAAREARARGDTAAACWLFSEAGRSWAEAGRQADAEAALRASADLAGTGKLAIQALEARGRALQPLVETIDEVQRTLEEAVRRRQAVDPDGLATAAALEAVGLWISMRGEFASEDYFLRALRIREALAPGSLVHARVLIHLGRVRYARSDWDGTESLAREGLEMARVWEAEGNVVASAWNALGNAGLHRASSEASEECYRRAIALRERVEPFSLEVCRGTNNLGVAAMNRGEPAAAAEMYERAYTCFQEAAPHPRWLGIALRGRAAAAVQRGQFDAARDFLRRAPRLGPTGSTFGLRALGEVELMAGDPAAARRYLERAYAIEEAEYRDSLWRGETVALLGEASRRLGDLDSARRLLEQALTRQQALSPGSLAVARNLDALGAVAQDAGDEAGAEERYRAALEIRKALAPGSSAEAESLHRLGVLRRRAGRLDEAAALHRQAVDALETHARRIGGTQEARSSFRARYRELYQDLVRVLVELGRVEEALGVVERSRARVLLEWLAQRDLSFAKDVPAELEREARAVRVEYDRTQGELEGLNPGADREKVDRLLGHLRDLQSRRGLVADRMRAASPHAAALRYPEPLDAAGVAAALDPGTVLLSYSVGADRTHLFVVGGAAGPAVHTLPVGEQALKERVAAFLTRVQRPYAADAAAVRSEGTALFDLLVAPAEPRIADATRVVLCPDGPLHLLPFAALVRRDRYLVEWKPLHVVASATVYAELRRSRAASGETPPRLAAFGDPRPDPRQGLSGLPAARGEVASIRMLFPGRSAAYLGAGATEARARALPRDVSHVHFACHARLDERFPLDSALVLSPGPAGENGLLQAWEIFEGVRLESDLVTLSACETALGRDMGGEGLMGLTRAFLYAGARSVLASLWRVSDKTTADLMARFYRHLVRGTPKDEALRAAQLETIRAGGRGARPFRWAAFQLFGDWR